MKILPKYTSSKINQEESTRPHFPLNLGEGQIYYKKIGRYKTYLSAYCQLAKEIQGDVDEPSV